MVCGAHENGTHVVGLKVHDNGHHTAATVQEFPGFGVVKAINPHNSVAHLKGLPDLLELKVGFHVP